jgi:hypothetical protein
MLHQLRKRPRVRHPARFEEIEPVCVLHRTQAVGNHDRDLVFGVPLQRALYARFGFVVQRARGLVENQYRRVFVDGLKNFYKSLLLKLILKM